MEIPAVYENGVCRPLEPVELPHTVGLLALLDSADQGPASADAAYQRLKLAGRDPCGDGVIFLKAARVAARTPYRKAICDIRRDRPAVARSWK